MDDGRARALIAVVQIDQRAIEREGELNLAPVGLVGRHVLRRSAFDRGRGVGDLVDAVATRREARTGRGSGQPQK